MIADFEDCGPDGETFYCLTLNKDETEKVNRLEKEKGLSTSDVLELGLAMP